jgi:hypothetical protein
VDLTVLVAPSGSLLASFDNEGISNDTDVSAADFDNDGNSYSAQALATAGLTAGQSATVDGVQFNWPAPAPGYPDNTVASGQQVTLNAPPGTQTLGFLGAANSGPSEGIATLNYSDGSTAQYWLGFSDWTLNAGKSQPSYGNQVAATTTYRNCSSCSSGQDVVATDVFYAGLPVDPTKTLTSVTLPSTVTAGGLHVFSVATSSQPLSPLAASVSPATAAAGQQVTINGSGFGASQGSGYVAFSDNGTNWGAPGNTATLQIDGWSDSAITFTVPTPSGSTGQYYVVPGTTAAGTPPTPRPWRSRPPPTRVTTTTTRASRQTPTRPGPTTTAAGTATRRARWPPPT